MELPHIQPLGFYDTVSYLVPGSVLVLAVVLSGALGCPTELLESSSLGTVVLLVGGSYVVGQAIYPLRVLLVWLLSKGIGDPRSYLLGCSSPPKLPAPLLYVGPLAFGEDLTAQLRDMVRSYLHGPGDAARSGTARATAAAICERWDDAYTICVAFVRQHSPASIQKHDRLLALRNMHGGLAVVLASLALILFLDLPGLGYRWTGILSVIGAILSLRSCYALMVSAARDILTAFHVLRRDCALKQ